MRSDAREVATGRWPSILAALGVDPFLLTGKHTACPTCGGKDRFRFDDKDGRGTFFCSHCGAGDGYTLLQKFRGWDFRTAAREVKQIAGTAPAVSPAATLSDDAKVQALRRVWSESRPMQSGDEAMRYLAGRGLQVDLPLPALRLHSRLAYREGAEFGRFPALVAMVTGPDGKGVTLHRTYLKDGRKAPVSSPKKLMPGRPIKGAAIRLHSAGDVLGVAEGIETALAARQLFGVPVWSCISAGGIESFRPPPEVGRVIVFGDNDENGTGQAAAWALAKRLIGTGIAAEVRIPERNGDWLDVLNQAGGKP